MSAVGRGPSGGVRGDPRGRRCRSEVRSHSTMCWPRHIPWRRSSASARSSPW